MMCCLSRVMGVFLPLQPSPVFSRALQQLYAEMVCNLVCFPHLLVAFTAPPRLPHCGAPLPPQLPLMMSSSRHCTTASGLPPRATSPRASSGRCCGMRRGSRLR
jgi:hypothetical protein